MTPRTIGRRKAQWRAMLDSIVRLTCAISPFGVRTATAQLTGPRIITPSRTACPPTVAIASGRLAARAAPLRALGRLEAPLEALNPAARVHELLLTRVERVAIRANLDVKLGLRRTRLERVPAGARYGREAVIGMDLCLQAARKAAAGFVAMLPPETTATTVERGSTSTFPERSAAVDAAAPSSEASFVRE